MLFVAFFALLLVVCEYFGLLSSATPATPRLPAWLWVAFLVGSYALQLAIVSYAAHHQYSGQAWRAAMPLAVVDDRGLPMANADAVTAVMLVLAALQSYALLALYRSCVSRRALIAGCVLMLLLSLASPALLSFDAYGYVHDALLGLAAYQPPDVPFTGAYHVFDRWFGGPSPTLYGPLWLVLIRVVTALGPTLFAKLMLWRVFCAAAYLALLLALRAYGVPARILTVAALNPGMMLQFVANAHNDVIALVLLVVAAAFMRAGNLLTALGMIAVAGLVKLPYAVLGLPVLSAVSARWTRLGSAALLLVVVTALSWIGGGSAYFGTLIGHVGERPEDLAHRLAGVAALALIAVTLIGGRRLRTAPWIFPSLASSVFAWYYAWGLPYALARRRVLSYLLVCFPFVAMLMETAFERTWELLFVLPAVALLSLFAPEKPVTPGPRPRRTRLKRRRSVSKGSVPA
jgi:hypothetical protein